jgi:LysR family transcriptional regulator for bpeEF and oprC
MALDRIEAMRAFCRIVEFGSFVAAADSLNVASTTISGQIQALERLLAVKLLHRSTRKVYPTNEGLAYYQRARQAIDDIDDLEASISMSRSVVRGRVAVEMPSPVGINLVIPAMRDFTDKYPEIHLDIGCSERVVGLMQEGIDCAIRGGEIADQDLMCASPTYLNGHALIAHPSQLATHSHLGFRFPGTGKRFIASLHKNRESHLIDYPPHIFFNNGSAVTAGAVAGLGIAALPRAEVQHLLESEELVEILPDWDMAGMPMSVVYPQTHQLSARVQVFVKWIAKLFESDPVWSSKKRPVSG